MKLLCVNLDGQMIMLLAKPLFVPVSNEFKVIGVVADFNYASVKQKIAPLMMLLGDNYGGLIVKIKTKM